MGSGQHRRQIAVVGPAPPHPAHRTQGHLADHMRRRKAQKSSRVRQVWWGNRGRAGASAWAAPGPVDRVQRAGKGPVGKVLVLLSKIAENIVRLEPRFACRAWQCDVRRCQTLRTRSTAKVLITSVCVIYVSVLCLCPCDCVSVFVCVCVCLRICVCMCVCGYL